MLAAPNQLLAEQDHVGDVQQGIHASEVAGALIGAGLFGAVYERGGFLSAAALAAGCLAGALAVAVTARIGQAPGRAEAASCPSAMHLSSEVRACKARSSAHEGG